MSRARATVRSAKTYVQVLGWLFIAWVGVATLRVIQHGFELTIPSEGLDEDAFEAYMLGANGLAVINAGLFIATVVTFAMWMNRSNKIALSFSDMLRHGPNGWGWFFCPFANLVVPYRAVKELYTAARPAQWVPGFFAAWWGTWIAAGVLSRLESRLALRDDPSTLSLGAGLALVAALLIMAAAILARKVVLAVYDAQELHPEPVSVTPPVSNHGILGAPTVGPDPYEERLDRELRAQG